MQPKEARKLVADALRSGKYTQGKNRLCKFTPEGPTYCCLGVACEVFIEQGGDLKVIDTSIVRSFGKSTATLPVVVAEWLDIKQGGSFAKGHTLKTLIHANDVYNKTFDEIADLFEDADFLPFNAVDPVDEEINES